MTAWFIVVLATLILVISSCSNSKQHDFPSQKKIQQRVRFDKNPTIINIKHEQLSKYDRSINPTFDYYVSPNSSSVRSISTCGE